MNRVSVFIPERFEATRSWGSFESEKGIDRIDNTGKIESALRYQDVNS